jgi:hypothetical protein
MPVKEVAELTRRKGRPVASGLLNSVNEKKVASRMAVEKYRQG